jgi:hypothetical protein
VCPVDSCTAKWTAIARRPWTRETITTSFKRGEVDLEDWRQLEHREATTMESGVHQSGKIKITASRQPIGGVGARSYSPILWGIVTKECHQTIS